MLWELKMTDDWTNPAAVQLMFNWTDQDFPPPGICFWSARNYMMSILYNKKNSNNKNITNHKNNNKIKNIINNKNISNRILAPYIQYTL